MKKIHRFDEVHDSQQMFRLLLKAMANPLQKVSIKPYADKLFGEDKAFLAIAFTLLDNEELFYTFQNDTLDSNIQSLTLAQKADCAEADFIFVANKDDLLYAIQNAKCGTLADPHKSAAIFVKISSKAEMALTMRGPGIAGSISLSTDSLVLDAIAQRDNMAFEYPQGIDFIFIDEQDNLFAVPRLAKREG